MDHAVVVGIAQYPASSGVLPTLDGPDVDARAVYDWLVDPGAGGLDPGNVELICSSQFDPIDAQAPQPTQAAIQAALERIEAKTRNANGNRLYLYFSGHGFSPALEEGALFTAESKLTFPYYVYAHSWLKAFRRAGLFREVVLWMDCCMTYQQSIVVNEAGMRTQSTTKPPGPAFIGLAAQTKKALEHTMTDGRVHGVFTWALLEGLRGGAADERGRVTGESLKAFLHSAMPEYLPDTVRRATAVDLHPFVRADEGMVFCRFPERPTYAVRLRIPGAAAGQRLNLWTGRPHVAAVNTELGGPEWNGRLVRGLYVAEVPDANLRQGFQVRGSGDVDVTISESGPPVAPPDWSRLFPLDVEADNPAAEIMVTDYKFERIFTGTGALHDRDAPGVYKIRVQFGRDIGIISEKVVLLDQDQAGSHQIDTPPLPSPAPIPGTALTDQSHVEPFSDAVTRASEYRSPRVGSTVISILARSWTDPAAPPTDRSRLPHPLEGLQLIGPTGPLPELRPEGLQVDNQANRAPVAVWEHEVEPGVHFLRQTLAGDRQFEGAVVAVPGWLTQVAINQSAAVGDGPGQAGPAAVSEAAVFMRATDGSPRLPEQDAVVEAARLALAQGRNVFGGGRGVQLHELLLDKYGDPIAGIIGCHLLLIAIEAEAVVDPEQTRTFDTALRHLRDLVGPDHPDVAALSLRSADPEPVAPRPFTAPPMFARSWQLMADASYDRPELITAELWNRVHASIAVGPFLAWAVDETSRALHAQQLARWMEAHAASGPMPEETREAARLARIPAAAAAALWEA
jgi:Caspase domain